MVQDSEPIICINDPTVYVKALQNITLQYPLKNVLFLNYYTSKKPYFYFFANVRRMPKEIK